MKYESCPISIKSLSGEHIERVFDLWMFRAYARAMSGRHARVDSSVGRRWRGKLVTMLAAWMAAFLIVTALLSFFGDQLGSLPLALRALVISGVLMTTMTTVVMPVLSAAVERWLAGPVQPSHSRRD
jgi:antibiotic biosynthesis monooxygenase (ABM) superfamily enzyme